MVKVSFTGNLARHVDVQTMSLENGTLSEVLQQLFLLYPALQSYIVDEQGNLRKHVMLAVDKTLVQSNFNEYRNFSDFTRLHIMQALSGG